MIIIHSEKAKHKYLHILRSRAEFKLSFTRQEVFGNMILSLDKLKKRLMVSDVSNPLRLRFNIDLSKTRFISIRKIYRDIQGGQLHNNKLENSLEAIHLQFEFADGQQAVYLPLFERNNSEPKDMSIIEKNAVLWQILLSKLRLQ